MDHLYIEDNQIAERHLLGKLAAAEAARFEEHALGCAECLDRLEMAERLHRGLTRLAAQELASRAGSQWVARVGLLARLASLSRSRQASLFATLALLLVVLPTGLLLVHVDRLDQRLAVARSAAAGKGPQVAALAAQLGAARGDLLEQKAQREGKERELTTERQRREELEHELARAERPQVNTPIVPLSAERSGGSGGAPTSQIVLPPLADWVVLSLDVEGAGPEAPRYRVTLLGAHGDELWKSSDLNAAGTGSLALSLPRALLAAGDYRLRVEGLPAQGAPFPVARFAFRIVRRF